MAPNQSMRTPSRRVCGRRSTRETTASATMPIGTFTRKTQRQPEMPRMLSAPENTPPSTGPSTELVPNTARK
ncbi:hypothetical protein TSOC111612_23365 [Tsukamurella ocularis]